MDKDLSGYMENVLAHISAVVFGALLVSELKAACAYGAELEHASGGDDSDWMNTKLSIETGTPFSGASWSTLASTLIKKTTKENISNGV